MGANTTGRRSGERQAAKEGGDFMLGQRVKQARLAKGLTQAELAHGKFSRSYIGAIERGRIKPSAENLAVIAEFLGQPLLYFMPQAQEEAETRLLVLLNEVKALLAVKEFDQARAMFEECSDFDSSQVAPLVQGLYFEAKANIEASDKMLLRAVDTFKVAAQAYELVGQTLDAWRYTFSAAMALYHCGQLSYAVFMALESLDHLKNAPEHEDELSKTHYLVGSCYTTLGNCGAASAHFALAEEVGSLGAALGVKALIAKASCLARQGNWPEALVDAQRAAALSDQLVASELKAEALIGAAVCLISLQDTLGAQRMLSELLELPQIGIATKRKAYREVLLALSELPDHCETFLYEDALQGLMLKPDDTTLEWEQLKDKWALTKCRLRRAPLCAESTVSSFSQSFTSLERYRDAAAVLVFGAKLLEQQEEHRAALLLMKRACNLLIGRPQ